MSTTSSPGGSVALGPSGASPRLNITAKVRLRLLGEPSFGKSRRSNSGARLLFFPPFHRHAAEHKENGATSCRQQEPAETRIPQDSSKQRFETRVTEIHPVGKGSRQPSRLTCSSTLPAALKQKKHNVAAQDLYLPTTGLS